MDGPTTFGRYELLNELASGGMASVWLARTTGEGGFVHVCAVKRVHPHLVKQAVFVDMFLDEARIAAQIQHPNVCRVFDYGLLNGIPYLAMEFLAGVSFSALLSTLVREPGTSRLIAACHLIAEAADGLHAAHELRGPTGESRDVVHRDISPQNLFLTLDGIVKVVDFGIASARDKVHETQTGEVKGKFPYMPPEQMRGARVDRRADIWSLGVVLWELCTLESLFRKRTQPETMDAVLRAPIAPPSSRRSDVTPALDRITARALARDVGERYATASELARDLESAASELGVPWSRSTVSTWVNSLFPKERARVDFLVANAAVTPRVFAAAVGGSEAVEPPEAFSIEVEGTAADVATRRARSTPKPVERRSSRVVLAVALAGLATAAVAVIGLGPWVGSFAPALATPAESARDEVIARAVVTSTSPPRIVAEAEAATEPIDSPLNRQAAGSAEIDGPDDGGAAAAPEGATGELPWRASGGRPHYRPSPVPTPAGAAPQETTSGTPAAPLTPPPTEGLGCIRVGLGVSARILNARVDGPHSVPVPAGSITVTLLEPGSGAVAGTTVLDVAPGAVCARLVARQD